MATDLPTPNNTPPSAVESRQATGRSTLQQPCGVARKSLTQLVDSGRIRAVKINGGIALAEEDVKLTTKRYELWARVEHLDGWHTFDLREYGESSWYYNTQWGVITTGSGQWCAFEYAAPNLGGTVGVLVIEVQVPLSDPCLVDGSCRREYP